jgi:ABC-type phosphate transport system substrate-binding protein
VSRISAYCFCVITLVAAHLSPLPALAATGGDVAIVVGPDTPVENLTFSEVRKLFLGDRQFWNTNHRVTLLIRAPVSRERDVVLKTIYQMTEAQYRQYWISKVFRAEVSTGPKIVLSNSMAADLALSIPGSVAFVDATQVPKGLKVIRIDGSLPGDARYPLR